MLGQRTEGFSGSDVSVVVKDVLMQPIRLIREATHFRCARQGAAGVASPRTAVAYHPLTISWIRVKALSNVVAAQGSADLSHETCLQGSPRVLVYPSGWCLH